MVFRVVLLLRLAGLVSIINGLIGGYVWLVALADRSDGDSLRLGFFHNPFMHFPPFNEAFVRTRRRSPSLPSPRGTACCGPGSCRGFESLCQRSS